MSICCNARAFLSIPATGTDTHRFAGASSEFFHVHAQIEFQGPRRTWLLVKVPVSVCDRLRIDEGFLGTFGFTLMCSRRAYLSVDDDVRDMNTTRSKFACNALRKRAQAELADRNSSETRSTP